MKGEYLKVTLALKEIQQLSNFISGSTTCDVYLFRMVNYQK